MHERCVKSEGFSNSPWEAQVRLPEGERMHQIRGVFQRIVRGKLRSSFQKVREGRLGVNSAVSSWNSSDHHTKPSPL